MKKLLFILALCLLGATQYATAQSADTVKVFTLEVGNLNCDNDMPTIRKSLLNGEGVDEVVFTKRKKYSSVFTITYHTAATSPADIMVRLEDTPGCDAPDEKPYKIKNIGTDKPLKR